MTTAPPPIDRIRELLVGIVGPAAADVPADSDLADTFPDHYDSLGAAEFVSAVETAYDFEVDFVGDDVRYWFSRLERVDEYVGRRLADQAALAGPRGGTDL